MSKGILSLIKAIADDDANAEKGTGLKNISVEEALERVRVILNFVPGQKIRFLSNGRFENAIFFRMEAGSYRCECISFDEKDGFFCLSTIIMSSIVLPGETDEEYLAKASIPVASSD